MTELDELVQKGLLSCQLHPSAKLRIFNYTNQCQYSRSWDEWTLQARGLILDDANKVISRGFNKFFNLADHVGPLPEEDFKVLDKLDGSLGILYFANDIPWIATRGSFESPQAQWATHYFRNNHLGYKPPEGKTAVFEIIYPNNRIVVDYGRIQGLFHLGLVDNQTGLVSYDLDKSWNGPITSEFPSMPPEELIKHVRSNCEGYVIRYRNGFQIKIKLEEYVRLHRIIFQTSSRTIWEHLSQGGQFDDLINNAPDEIKSFINQWAVQLSLRYSEVFNAAKNYYDAIPKGLSRRDFAGLAINYYTPSILFAMLDDKDVSKIIWKIIEPKWVPAKIQSEEEG